jgi:hypothetical protein
MMVVATVLLLRALLAVAQAPSTPPPQLACGAAGRWKFFATAWDMTCGKNLTAPTKKIPSHQSKHGYWLCKNYSSIFPNVELTSKDLYFGTNASWTTAKVLDGGPKWW